MSLRDAAIAAWRFGLGARPGELRNIAQDPRGWLEAQLVRSVPLPAPLQALPSTADDQAAFFLWLRDYTRDTRRASRRATRQGDGEQAATVEQSYVKALLPRYAVVVEARMRTAIESSAPFRERLVRFWSNHFVVSAAKPVAIALPGSYERDVARRFVTSRFVDMLLAAEKHPAMLLFLDNAQSIGPNSALALRPRQAASAAPEDALARANAAPLGLNENLAREILELHTLGVNGGYQQADVAALARAITGWHIRSPRRQPVRKRFADWTAEDFFLFDAAAHEPGPQVVLGKTYPQQGVDQGEAVLRDLAAHPSTARFIATKLARHFAADEPPPVLIDRLAARFRDSDGDLAEVARALVHSAEVWQQLDAKFLPPEDYVVAATRALDGPYLTGVQYLTLLGEMGQRPYWPAGPDGWKDAEREWLGPDALWKRLEWADLAARAQARGDIDPLTRAEDVLGPRLRPSTRDAMQRAESARQALALLLVSPELMRR